jgi:hypothetical protein
VNYGYSARRPSKKFLTSINLAVSENPETLAFIIVKYGDHENTDPEYISSDNLVNLRKRTFDNHSVTFRTRTIELALSIAAQIYLIRSAERVLDSSIRQMHTLARLRNKLYMWFILAEPSVRYTRDVSRQEWEQLHLEDRLQYVMSALD